MLFITKRTFMDYLFISFFFSSNVSTNPFVATTHRRTKKAIIAFRNVNRLYDDDDDIDNNRPVSLIQVCIFIASLFFFFFFFLSTFLCIPKHLYKSSRVWDLWTENVEQIGLPQPLSHLTANPKLCAYAQWWDIWWSQLDHV